MLFSFTRLGEAPKVWWGRGAAREEGLCCKGRASAQHSLAGKGTGTQGASNFLFNFSFRSGRALVASLWPSLEQRDLESTQQAKGRMVCGNKLLSFC